MIASDSGERLRALDPQGSFIVQAPAGSGKTELLIQRYLALLARVEEPEEIAAITFTRKSAAEMRRRVLGALATARTAPRPAQEHHALTWEHARAVLARDAAHGWRLQSNAARLRVQTIDALCASLTRQMPVLARIGAQPEIVEDAAELYRQAAHAAIALVEARHAVAEDAAVLLSHLDNHVETAAGLLGAMLARRDQWLRAMRRGLDREHLEAGLKAERSAALEGLEAAFGPSPPVGARAGVQAWQALADELLRKDGEWRKQSAQAQALAARDDGERLRRLLGSARRLPPERYGDAQWAVLGALSRLLAVAVAQLKLLFAERGQADFAEIAQAASAALGEPEEPTDLMLSLDYRIRHLLVDEFQDTSFTQYELLERLTAGWEPGDGRTLFLVGDPMQSIYRFREAEVSLFLRARNEGLGTVRLQPLRLSANFRSQPGIVDWVNQSFARVLPAQESVAAGAVPYAASAAVRSAGDDGAVGVHAFFEGDAPGEAQRVVDLVRQARAREPQGTIAVLVRNRAHLEQIVPALRSARIGFCAIEIEQLGQRQVVQDLLALTRALSHPADRAAWLAVLRAPWCGLTLADLLALCSPPECPGGEAMPHPRAARQCATDDLFPETLAGRAPPAQPALRSDARLLWEAMHDAACLERLGADGRAQLERVRGILDQALSNRLRGSLRERVESAWMALGGPACAGGDTDLEDALVYLDRLEACEHAGELPDPAAFEAGLARLYAVPDAGAGSVQLLTIHKAKGLEFDTVIVPGLGAAPRRRDPSLLLWCERTGARGASRLLVAPMREAGGQRDPIYDYLARLEDEKESHEDARLLYVAATRARSRLHLLGDTRIAHGAPAPPAAGSLLEKLWPAVEADFARQLAALPARGARPAPRSVDQRLRRLAPDWRMPPEPPALEWTAAPEPRRERDEIEFSWAGETARHVGSVVHRWLQRIAEDRLEQWNRARIRSLRDCVLVELAARGVGRDELGRAAERVLEALARTVASERGRWLLGPRRDARSEVRIATLTAGRRATLVVDRVFTDEDGRRWIVDYKTSSHEGADPEAFLDRERGRYAAQLERYALALGDRQAALGLFFPLLCGWREWYAGQR